MQAYVSLCHDIRIESQEYLKRRGEREDTEVDLTKIGEGTALSGLCVFMCV